MFFDLNNVTRLIKTFFMTPSLSNEALPGGGDLVTCLNFKMSRVGVYKCLLLIVGFAITVAIWPREVASCCDFILRAVATFWAMSLVRICPGRASLKQYLEEGCSGGERMRKELDLGEKKPRSKKDKRERVF